MLLEICASSYKSAQVAVLGGANRIELCEDLSIGGITPNSSLLSKVINDFTIETHVLIRQRGGDFCYSPLEVKEMISDVKLAKKIGAKGVVFGALTQNRTLDLISLTALVQAAQGMDYSFHKAFDELENPEPAIEQLIKMGFTRILTSGGKRTAFEGLPHLIQWQKNFGNQIEIMPGGGIRPENISSFLGHKFKSVHSAAIPKGQLETDLQTVKKIKVRLLSSED